MESFFFIDRILFMKDEWDQSEKANKQYLKKWSILGYTQSDTLTYNIYTDTLTYDCENIKGAMSMYGSSKTAMTQLHPAQKKVAALFIL